MQMHPRFKLVNEAKHDLNLLLIEWTKKHDLTYLEAAKIFNAEVATYLKFALRVERHGDDQLEADLI